MDILNKYIWMIETIYNSRKGITFNEIKERWDNDRNMRQEGELVIRTFHRYRDKIEEDFCINIDCMRNKYFISNREDLDNDTIRLWLFNTYSINNLIGKNGQLRKRILFEEIPSGKYYLTDVIEAMRNNQRIEIGYQKYQLRRQQTVCS
jgi:hypothetical protein